MATRQLHEILAVDADRAHAANEAIKETEDTFRKRKDHFVGLTKDVRFLDESRQGENLTDSKSVDDTVMKRLNFMAKRVGPSFDTLATKEATNQVSSADVIVDGKVLLKDMPGTLLLALEKRLHAMVTVYRLIPTLVPGVAWEEDATLGEGVYRAPVATQMKTEKVFGSVVLYDATEHHPAQVKETSQDRPVARIDNVHYSAMISPARKAGILARLEKLEAAVKQARQRANRAEIVNVKVSDAIFGYLHQDIDD